MMILDEHHDARSWWWTVFFRCLCFPPMSERPGTLKVRFVPLGCVSHILFWEPTFASKYSNAICLYFVCSYNYNTFSSHVIKSTSFNTWSSVQLSGQSIMCQQLRAGNHADARACSHHTSERRKRVISATWLHVPFAWLSARDRLVWFFFFFIYLFI